MSKTIINREDYIRLRNKNKSLSNTEFAALLKKAEYVGKNGEPFSMHMVEARNIRYQITGQGNRSNKPKTLEEIKMEARETFMNAGGEHFSMVPCLNDNDDHTDLLANVAKDRLLSG